MTHQTSGGLGFDTNDCSKTTEWEERAPKSAFENSKVKSASMINFGRNTLYNPQSQDVLDMMTVGNAEATSAAAANLIRPIYKPESRRSSTNSQIGRTKARKGARSFMCGLMSTSRDASQEEKPSFSGIDAESDEFGDDYIKSRHHSHNRRMDFPYRKSAGGSSALSKISNAQKMLQSKQNL
jgi:hypothetical protein